MELKLAPISSTRIGPGSRRYIYWANEGSQLFKLPPTVSGTAVSIWARKSNLQSFYSPFTCRSLSLGPQLRSFLQLGPSIR